ncbi:MAG: ExsB family transcriptional regulator [Eggerthellaceae bacterium]|nr:ExsB family transcriptional regulator [Eggerthellaceae bacterium]
MDCPGTGTKTLDEFCAEHPRVALAFSGGGDSSYLLSALLDRSVQVKAYFVQSAFQYPFETADARRVACELGAELEVIELDVLSQEAICANPPDRCYLCKRFIFGAIQGQMAREGFSVLVDGTNATDDPARRPGFRALAELGVLSPLRLAGLGKDEVRQAAHACGLFTADKPNFSCLATKVETGTPLTAELLGAVLKQEEETGSEVRLWNSMS